MSLFERILLSIPSFHGHHHESTEGCFSRFPHDMDKKIEDRNDVEVVVKEPADTSSSLEPPMDSITRVGVSVLARVVSNGTANYGLPCVLMVL